jgi:hypothetical protein
MHQSELRHRRRGPPRARALLAPALAALLLHGAVLGGSGFGSASLLPPLSVTSVQVRWIDVAVEPAIPLEKPAAPAAPGAAVPRRPASRPVVEARPSPVASVVEEPAPAARPSGAEVPTAVAAMAAAADPPAAASSGDAQVPTYRTRFAPPATLRYALRRGILSGTGELQWRPAGDRYETRLEGRVAGLTILVQTSRGLIDAAGLAPERYVDQRPRDTRAANFQRDKGLITFSGPATEYPLLPGSQDRLSWMIQLGAILNAEPQRASPGAKVSMFVAGARGEADVWIFRFEDREDVAAEGATAHAVKFTREPRRPYDTQVDVWLDPARHHLPVRARLTTLPDGASLELLLRDIQ